MAINKNRCKICGLPFRLEHLYESTTEIVRETSPIYTNNFEGEQSFANYDEFKNNGCCDFLKVTDIFAVFAMGLLLLNLTWQHQVRHFRTQISTFLAQFNGDLLQ